MQQIIGSDDLRTLDVLMNKKQKTTEELKSIHEIIRHTSFFNKIFQQYDQSVNQEGIFKICNLISIQNFEANQVILKEGEQTNDQVYLLVKGRVSIYQLSQLDDFTNRYIEYCNIDHDHEQLGRQINHLYPGDLFGERATFQRETVGKRSASVVADTYVICLVLYKSQFDEVFKWFGQQFLDKHKALCKIIPDLSEMSSKKMLETLVTQFEDLKMPNDATITVENERGEYLYFLSDGIVSFYQQNQHICDLEENGSVGDELLIDPDLDFRYLDYEYTVKVKSAFALIYKIKSKTFQKLFPYRIINLLLEQYKSKKIMRQIMGSKKYAKIKAESVPILNQRNKEWNKQQIKEINKIDIEYQQYQVPQYSRVLKFNKKKLDNINKKKKQQKSKISMNQFVQLTKTSKIPQMKLLAKVENPYDFASNVNSQGFLKQYYANLIRVGLVCPQPIQEPQDQMKIQRSRVQSAIKLINTTTVKLRRATSSAQQPLIQITAYNSDLRCDKQSQDTTQYFQTPRTFSQPNLLNYYTPIHERVPSPIKHTPSTTMTKQSTTKSQIFRPQSGFMDHSSRLSMRSEINKRRKRPNQFF